MPVVNPETGEPMSDDPEQADQALAGGEGRGHNVSAHDAPSEGTGVTTTPNNARESQPREADEGNALDASNSTGGV